MRGKLFAGLLALLLALVSPAAEPVRADITVQMGGAEPASVGAVWDDGWFAHSAAEYDQELAKTALLLSGTAYAAPGGDGAAVRTAGDALACFRFGQIRSFHYDYPFAPDDADVAAYTFAAKELSLPGGWKGTLIAVVVRGTSAPEEWYSNFNLGTGASHAGFSLAAEDLMEELERYLAGLGLDGGARLKFLVTGHSRGAAVAGLTAAALNGSEYASPEDVYGYTFASPAVSTQAGAEGYGNIFNIIDREDLVVRLPLEEWGYARFGVDLVLPRQSAPNAGEDGRYARMREAYRRLTGQPFVPYEDDGAVDALVNGLYRLAPSPDDFYHRQYAPSGVPMTVHEYFRALIDMLVNGASGAPGSASKVLAASLDENFSFLTSFFLADPDAAARVGVAHSLGSYYGWLSSCTSQELFGR